MLTENKISFYLRLLLCLTERATHLVCGSCKLNLEHVQTCWSARVCLTEHPSDTLRLFRELNCHTSYIKFSDDDDDDDDDDRVINLHRRLRTILSFVRLIA
jgi:hypothetical protein